MKTSNYRIVLNANKHLILEDIGPWNLFKSITNDINRLTKHLYETGILTSEKVFEYIDSEGWRTTVIHKNGEFVDFGQTVQ